MPGLNRSIVEHRLPIKSGYQPYQQGARRCNSKILPDINAEITRLIEANFIRQCRYACDTLGVCTVELYFFYASCA